MVIRKGKKLNDWRMKIEVGKMKVK